MRGDVVEKGGSGWVFEAELGAADVEGSLGVIEGDAAEGVEDLAAGGDSGVGSKEVLAVGSEGWSFVAGHHVGLAGLVAHPPGESSAAPCCLCGNEGNRDLLDFGCGAEAPLADHGDLTGADTAGQRLVGQILDRGRAHEPLLECRSGPRGHPAVGGPGVIDPHPGCVRRRGTCDLIRRGVDLAIRAEVLLNLTQRQHEGEPGVRAGGCHGIALFRGSQGHAGKTDQTDGEQRQQDHQRKRDHQRKAPRTADVRAGVGVGEKDFRREQSHWTGLWV